MFRIIGPVDDVAELLGSPALDRPLQCVTFQDVHAKAAKGRQVTMRSLARNIHGPVRATKSALPLLKLATFGELRTDKGSLRHDANMVAIDGIELDYDGESIAVDQASAKMAAAGVAALIYTSPSHTPDKPRWRMICPASRTLPPSERAALCAWINGLFGGAFAPESFSASQAYYYGRVIGAAEPDAVLVDGMAIDLATHLEAGALGRDGKPFTATIEADAPATDDDDDWGEQARVQGRAQTLTDRISRASGAIALVPIGDADGPQGRELWLQIGMALHSEFDGSTQGFQLWDEWSKPGAKYNAKDQRSKWESFGRKSGSRVTIATLYDIAKRYGWDARISTAAPGSETGTWAGGDIVNGREMAKQVRDELRYVASYKQWLKYSDSRWRRSASGVEYEAAKAVAGRLLEVASDSYQESPTEANKAKLGRCLALFTSIPRIDAMLKACRSEPGIATEPDAFDANPMQLGVPNGVIDLSTGQLIPPNPMQMISKQAGAPFNAAAACPRFLSFLDTIQPNPEIRDFLQRAVGYTLTGLVDEEKLLFCYGVGANGKSVFANIVAAVLGEYCVTVGAKLLTKSPHSNEADRLVFQLPGMRLALANETAQGDIWDDTRVKELASRERISARKLHAEAFSFMPTHKLWIRGNHLPGAHDASDGFWRRLIPVEFAACISEAERIPDLDRQIIATELPGVLAWAVRGCLEWQRIGLQVPQCISKATNRYRSETDILGQWIEDRCKIDPAGLAIVQICYADFSRFCVENGITRPPSKMQFSRQMTARGFERHRDTSKRQFIGIALRHDGGFDDLAQPSNQVES